MNVLLQSLLLRSGVKINPFSLNRVKYSPIPDMMSPMFIVNQFTDRFGFE